MKERNVVLFTLGFAFIIIIFLIAYFSQPIEQNIVEIFADSTLDGKIVFAFVEVNEFEESAMQKLGRKLLRDNITLDLLRRDIPVITIVHFYNSDNADSLSDDVQKRINKVYPHINGKVKNLRYVKEGYIYSGMSRRIERFNLPRDTLFKSSIVIPRKGLKAKDILIQK